MANETALFAESTNIYIKNNYTQFTDLYVDFYFTIYDGVHSSYYLCRLDHSLADAIRNYML